jgi:hypothetical protein
MRSVFVLGLLMCIPRAPAIAANLHHSRSPTAQLRVRQDVSSPPSQGQTAPGRLAVPGWTEDETQRWLDAASSAHGG